MRSRLVIATLLTLSMLAFASAQPGNVDAFVGGSVSKLVNNKAVQEDLKLTEDQAAKVKEWIKEFRTRAAEIRKEKGVEPPIKKTDTSSVPEQLKKIAAANEEIRRVSYKELSDILSNKQLERLRQIERQSMGQLAFSREEIATTLKLTETQKESIKGLLEDLAKAKSEIVKNSVAGGTDIERVQNAMKEVRKIDSDYLSKTLALLTDVQKTKWKSLTGEPFDLEKLSLQLPMKKD